MLQGEITHLLGFDIHSKQEKETNNRRNGFGSKKVKTSFGEVPIDLPRDREASLNQNLLRNVNGMFQLSNQRFCPCMHRHVSKRYRSYH